MKKRQPFHQARVAVMDTQPPLSPKDTRALALFIAGWGRSFFTGRRFWYRGSVVTVERSKKK